MNELIKIGGYIIVVTVLPVFIPRLTDHLWIIIIHSSMIHLWLMSRHLENHSMTMTWHP